MQNNLKNIDGLPSSLGKEKIKLRITYTEKLSDYLYNLAMDNYNGDYEQDCLERACCMEVVGSWYNGKDFEWIVKELSKEYGISRDELFKIERYILDKEGINIIEQNRIDNATNEILNKARVKPRLIARYIEGLDSSADDYLEFCECYDIKLKDFTLSETNSLDKVHDVWYYDLELNLDKDKLYKEVAKGIRDSYSNNNEEDIQLLIEKSFNEELDTFRNMLCDIGEKEIEDLEWNYNVDIEEIYKEYNQLINNYCKHAMGIKVGVLDLLIKINDEDIDNNTTTYKEKEIGLRKNVQDYKDRIGKAYQDKYDREHTVLPQEDSCLEA